MIKQLYLEKKQIVVNVLNNMILRTILFLIISFIINIIYALFNILTAIVSHSLWCGALASYYTLLVILRTLLLKDIRKLLSPKKESPKVLLYEIKQYRMCGMILIILTICLVAFILLIVRSDKVFNYSMIMIYIIAGYTLFQWLMATLNYFKAKKINSYIIRSLRSINLTTSLVSLLSLQAIALDTFSKKLNIPVVNAITGFVICTLIVNNGLRMILSANSQIEKMKISV